jgi:hypothetical protein
MHRVFKFVRPGFLALGLLLLGLAALSVRVSAANESGDTSDCTLLRTYADGRRLFLCPPELNLTATPPPTATRPATATAPPTATRLPTSTTPPSRGVVVDHNSVALFDRIPDSYLQAAAAMSMVFIDRSVGQNIDEGLTCLSYPSLDDAPNYCRRITHPVPEFSVDRSVLAWSRPGGYNRSNWTYLPWPDSCGAEWYDKVGGIISLLDTYSSQYDVVSYQFSYLEVSAGSSIEDQPGGFFSDNPNRFDVYDQAAAEAEHPGTIFIYWTTSLARGVGTEEARSFNDQMRQYTASHELPLFDVADILSHDPSGNPCYDNRDGVPYNPNGGGENYPDDGAAFPAICQHYTTEVDGGHLGSVSAGRIRVAKAFWVLMALLAGWSG